MGGQPMNWIEMNYQKSLAEDLKGVSAALENAVEQLDFIIQSMLNECDREDGCCK